MKYCTPLLLLFVPLKQLQAVLKINVQQILLLQVRSVVCQNAYHILTAVLSILHNKRCELTVASLMEFETFQLINKHKFSILKR